MGLALVPSALMLGLTTFLTIDIAPVPLLWALPLALYLASFIAAFATSPAADRAAPAMVFCLPGVVIVLLILLLVDAREPLWLVMPVHLAGFFVAALVCHGELARDRPPATHLTASTCWWRWAACWAGPGGHLRARRLRLGARVPDGASWRLPVPALAHAADPARAAGCATWTSGLPVLVGLLVTGALLAGALGASEFEGAGKSFAFGLGAGIALNFIRRPLRFGAGGGRHRAGRARCPSAGRHRAAAGAQLLRRATASPRRPTASCTTWPTAPRATAPRTPGRRRATPLTYFHPSGPVGQLIGGLPAPATRRVRP